MLHEYEAKLTTKDDVGAEIIKYQASYKYAKGKVKQKSEICILLSSLSKLHFRLKFFLSALFACFVISLSFKLT